MKRAGQIVLFKFPQTDLAAGKLRPALLLGKLPGEFDDWLVCMISSQIRHLSEGLDEIIQPADNDFSASGLKATSVGRLAVIQGERLLGAIGEIGSERLQRIKRRLAKWLEES